METKESIRLREHATAKGKIAKTSSKKEEKRLSAIAKFWATIDSNDGQITDMRAVLR